MTVHSTINKELLAFSQGYSPKATRMLSGEASRYICSKHNTKVTSAKKAYGAKLLTTTASGRNGTVVPVRNTDGIKKRNRWNLCLQIKNGKWLSCCVCFNSRLPPMPTTTGHPYDPIQWVRQTGLSCASKMTVSLHHVFAFRCKNLPMKSVQGMKL